MGVHGLASWTARHSSLGESSDFPGSETRCGAPVPFVVDALAFLYHTALSDTLRGGNYRDYRMLLSTYVQYWRACSLEPHFVFDGPSDQAKMETTLKRSQQNLAKSIKFFRASDEERRSPLVQALARRLPPLTVAAALAELKHLDVPMYFAEEEADSPTAELAQRLHGYVASSDSDYLIFNATHRGYAPLFEIQYGESRKSHLSRRDWQSESPAMRLRVYQHAPVARLLGIPPSFLPTFAALVGNDLVDISTELALSGHRPKYPGQMDSTSLERIARALSSLRALPISTADDQEALLVAALAALRPRPFDPAIIGNLMFAVSSYTLQSINTPSRTFPLHPQQLDNPVQIRARRLYLAAFRRGCFSGFLVATLKHGIWDTPGSVDNPDFASPAVVFGKPLRLWVYATFQNACLLDAQTVIERDRRQDRVHDVQVGIPTLASLLIPSPHIDPTSCILEAPPEMRLALYLAAFAWPSSATLPAAAVNHLPLLLSLRHIQSLTKRPWSQHELCSAILTSVILFTTSTDSWLTSAHTFASSRHFIQLSAELVQTLLHADLLAQALLLTDHLPSGHQMFHGALFHTFLEVDVFAVVSGLPQDQQSAVADFLRVVTS